MSDEKRFAVDAQVRVKNPGVNGVVTQFDDKPTALGEYWHTIQTEHGDRREPGCNLELLPRPLTNSEAGAPRSNQLGKDSLLAQIDEIIKTMPPRATIRHHVRENHNWFGRVSAAIEKWNPSKSGLLREYLNLFFSNGHARETAHGLNKLLVLLNQAHDELKTAQTQELMDHESGSAMQPALEQVRPTPKAFISYGWESDEHRSWVRELASRLRADGVNVSLDQWELQPGDQLPAFMERAVRENDYVLIVCTPQYKRRSDERLGGVGYEGDIMTAEALTSRTQRKFIPLFQSGNDWRNAGPTWVQGKYPAGVLAAECFQWAEPLAGYRAES